MLICAECAMTRPAYMHMFFKLRDFYAPQLACSQRIMTGEAVKRRKLRYMFDMFLYEKMQTEGTTDPSVLVQIGTAGFDIFHEMVYRPEYRLCQINSWYNEETDTLEPVGNDDVIEVDYNSSDEDI